MPCVSQPVNEEDNNNEKDNDKGDNNEEDDNDDDGDKEDDNDDNDDEEDTDDDEEEDIFDFDLNNIEGSPSNNARLASLDLLTPMPSAIPPSSNRPNKKKRAAPQGDFIRRVQPKRNVFKPTSYKNLDDPAINKRMRSIDSSDMGEENTVSKRMDEAEYIPSGGDNKEEDNDNELENYDDNDNKLDG